MQLTRAFPLAVAPKPLSLGFAGFQPLAVSGHIRDRCLVTYRAPARSLAPLLKLAAGEAPFIVDTYNGQGFVSVCAVDLKGMRIAGMPRAFSWDNREMLYRIGVRLPSGEPTFLTLRSDVSARPLSLLGKLFSHYRPHHANLICSKSEDQWSLKCSSRDGLADAEVIANIRSFSGDNHNSIFPSAEVAGSFLLGMKCSAAGGKLGIRTQPIEHTAWSPQFVTLERCRFDYLEQLNKYIDRELIYDSTLYVADVGQRWCRTRFSAEQR